MDDIEMLQSAIDDLNRLSLKGFENWGIVSSAATKVAKVKESLECQRKAREKAYQASLEEAKRRREQMKKEAAERGEEIIGGETIRINSDGTQEVLIP